MIVSTKSFQDALGHALVAVPTRPQLPILTGVKLEAADGYLTISGYDGTTQATQILEADGDLPTTLVNGTLLKNVVAKAKADSMAIDLEDSYLLVEAGRARVKLQTMPTAEYPKPLVTPDDGFSLDGTGWAALTRSVAHAASKEDSLPLLTAVNLTASAGRLTGSATDRYRLAENRISIDSDLEAELTVSAKTVVDISRHLDPSATWEIRFSDTLIAVSDGRSQIIRSLISGDYPNLDKIYPAETPCQATIDRLDLLDAVSRATALLGRGEAVLLTIESDSLTLEAGTGDEGSMIEELDCLGYEGEPTVLKFNPLYLSEAVASISSEQIHLGWTDSVRPTLITGDDPDHRQLVMPIRK